MAKRLVLGCACALMAVAGCGGGDNPAADTGLGGTDGGTDASTPAVDANVDAFHAPGADTGVDAFVAPGTDAGSDAGTSDGCELGNTYPALDLHLLHTFGSLAELPIDIVLAPGRDDLFIVLRNGRILIMNPTTGAVGATPFLDVSSRLGASPTGTNENGLLGLAFHPDYVSNGLLYIAYTAHTGGVMPYEDRVAVAMRSTADTATFGSDIFTIPDPADNHNGGQIGFGPDDGYLYYSVGDGGEQGDPSRRAQNTSVALGKIHRFQVGPGIATYNPAPGNPFLSGGGLATVWAYGLRNPWRYTWDRRTHAMFIGDVGQNMWEEIDYLAAPLPAGSNFGWSICEGTHDFNGTCASLTGDVPPALEYSHAGGGTLQGNSVIGGRVYRGAAIPALNGAYIFADEGSSFIAAFRECPGSAVMPTELTSISNSLCQNPVAFGEDRPGEILISCLNLPSGPPTMYRIVAH